MKYFLFVLLFIPFQLNAQNYLKCITKSELKSNWTCIGPFNSEDERGNQHAGVLNCMSVNPADSNEIYIGSSGGLWYTTNRGQDWICISDTYQEAILSINDIIVDYTVLPHTILIATGLQHNIVDGANLGIFKSVNNGLQWTRCLNRNIDKSHFFSTFTHFAIHPTKKNIIFSTMADGTIYRTLNAGNSWQRFLGQNAMLQIDDIKHINSILVTENNQLLFTALEFYREKNGVVGKSKHQFIEIKNCIGKVINTDIVDHSNLFLFRDNKATDLGCVKIKKHPIHNDSIYLISTKTNSNELRVTLYSINKHKIIKELIPEKTTIRTDIYWFEGLLPHAYLHNKFYIANQLLATSNDTLKSVKYEYNYSYGENNVPHPDIREMYITKYSEDGLHDEMYLCTDGGLSFSNNSGQSFRNLNGLKLATTLCHSISSSPFTGTISIGCPDNGIMSYIPSTKKWIIPVQGDGYDVAYDKQQPNVLYGQYNNSTLLKSTNDIAPATIYMNLNNSATANVRKCLKTLKNGNLIFSSNKIQTLDFSNQWKSSETTFITSSSTFDVSEADSNIIYCAGAWSGLFKSTDGGKTFTDISANFNLTDPIIGIRNFKDAKINAICISPYDANELWISTGYMGDYLNICGPSIRIIHSTNGGKTWEDYSSELPVYGVSDIQFLEGTRETLFASTFNGIYIRTSANNPWELFSTNLPKCAISDIEISYKRNKLIIATFGFGVWETDLPDVKYTIHEMIKKDTIFKTNTAGKALYFNTNIEVKKNKKLIIDCDVYMAKNKKIITNKKSQLIITERGRLIYD
jgi:photosystem II stability/assembly factor-like uncharacterized protein